MVSPELTALLGVGAIMVTLQGVTLSVSVANARKVGVDEEARETATYAHKRITRHLRREHDKEVRTAQEAWDERSDRP